MKIGILTFHWGTNYGGVLQAYALQTYLRGLNCNVEIMHQGHLEIHFFYVLKANQCMLLNGIFVTI